MNNQYNPGTIVINLFTRWFERTYVKILHNFQIEVSSELELYSDLFRDPNAYAWGWIGIPDNGNGIHGGNNSDSLYGSNNSTTGNLFYNSNGAAAGIGNNGGQFAHLNADLTLNNSLFEVIG